jgi:hypothetical protein
MGGLGDDKWKTQPLITCEKVRNWSPFLFLIWWMLIAKLLDMLITLIG